MEKSLRDELEASFRHICAQRGEQIDDMIVGRYLEEVEREIEKHRERFINFGI